MYQLDFDYLSHTATKLQKLEENLSSKIFGQNHIIKEVIDKIKISESGLDEDDKPIASFLFLGSTGVGKTELAKELAKNLDMNFLRLDMSEFNDDNSVGNLIGGNASYVGYSDGGILTNAILDNPRSVVLFDEIEKADKKVLNTFLQILDYGVLTSTKGEKVDFEETIIIFTSNLGVDDKPKVGFNSQKTKFDQKKIKEYFSPEFRARLDNILYFNPITEDVVKKIVDKFLVSLDKKLAKKDIYLEISYKLKSYLCDIGFNQNQGARGISKVINSKIKQTLSNEILFGDLSNGGEVYIDLSDDEIIYDFNPFSNSMNDPEYKFDTWEKACIYAKRHPGVIVTNSPNCDKYIIKGEIKTSDF